MDFVDVIFPLDIGPLTYKSPLPVEPGALVRAEIKKSQKTGVVLENASSPPAGGRKTKEIIPIEGKEAALGPSLISLIKWMSEHYFSSEGSVLKSIFPKEFFKPVKLRKKRPPKPRTEEILLETDGAIIKTLRKETGDKTYRTLLFVPPDTSSEVSYAVKLLEGRKNVIVLAPEIPLIERISGIIGRLYGERLSAVHSGLTGGERSEALRKISTGEADIVLGGRHALFAPLKNPSLIIVMREESPLYKEEGGIRFSARDMAVMRGYVEGAPVLLTSICPSAESYHNSLRGKYRLISSGGKAKRASVRVVDMRYARKKTPYLSNTLIKGAASRIKKGQGVIFLLNKKGYSMLRCPDCGHTETCPKCRTPLVLHKKARTLRCGICGLESPPPGLCGNCRGANISPMGAGLERAEEDLISLTGAKPLVLERGKKPHSSPAGGSFVIGTKLVAKRLDIQRASLAGVINADHHLYIPDFRARERAFQELMYLSEKADEMILQTYSPKSAFIKHTKKLDFGGFLETELKERASLMYPPFSKMAVIRFSEKPPPTPKKTSGAEILGPAFSVRKGGKGLWSFLVRAGTRQELREAVLSLTSGFKGKAQVEADPLYI